ncbi:MAG: polyketide synthase dehydratase domain-containing protein, partial [Acidobacteriaceae bacterium]|nr:polyketide synthase dehydratase domain-containing protein [Acidobacteriaceae bacterium]
TGGYRVPNPEAQGELIRCALHSAQITPESVSYIEAAANGSPLGDPIEIAGLQRGFCSSVRRIGSLKSNIGHLEAASGISQLTKVIGQLHENVLYPTIHTEPRNPKLGLEQTTMQLVETMEPWISTSPRRAAISSFGAGGANAHLIVEEAPLPSRNLTPGASELVLLSANTTEQLHEQCRQLITHLQRPEVKVNFADLAYTLQTGRESLPERLAIIASGVEELCAMLEQYLTGDDSSVLRGSPSGNLELVHLLEGQAGEAFFKSLVEARDLSRCARLWINGIEVNWNIWHEGRNVYRVPLPGYPFARRRCWIQSPGEPVSSVLHPFIHHNISTLTEQRYSSRFSGTEVYLAEHRVDGRPVLPAAVLIEMARAAAELAIGSPIYRLRKFNCIKPLQLDPGSTANVEIRLGAEETGAIAFTILSDVGPLVTGLADSNMTDGTARLCPESQGREILTPDRFYEGCALAGLQLGLYFRTVRSLRTAGEKVYAQLDLSNSDKRLYLEPGLLDGMLQTLAGFRYSETNQVLEVPFWIDTVEIHGALNGQTHVCASRSPGREGCYDLAAWNNCGQLAVQLLGVQTRPLSRTSADNIQFAQEMESVSGAVVTSIEPLLQSLAGEILKLSSSEVPRSKNFLDFGFDSTSLVLFARRIGDSLGIEISPAELFARPTIAQLAKSLDNRVSAPAQHSNHKEVTSRVAMLAAPKQQLTPSNAEPIAIIGMAGVLPGSPDLAAFWDHLASGHDLISEAPRDRWDWRSFESGKANEPNPTRWGGFLSNVDQFDPLFFGISPREAALMDPQQRLFLEVAWHAIEDAGYGPSHIAGTRTGLYVGVATSDYADLLRAHAHDVESQMATGIAHSILANRVSYLLDFRGPSQPVDTACSSSLVAIHHAVEAIRQGVCEMAIAGGVNVILSPILSLGFGRAGFMSPSGRCRAFSKEGDGYVRGEGAGAIFLKPLTRALR